jgi:membrane-associated phospholipid phosphatase
MRSFWILLSELGNSTWLLPAATLIALAAGAGKWLPWSAVWRWLGATALTALAVLASKIAFMGWGIGSVALDFTGFSGHAAMSAAIYPTLLAWLGQSLGRHCRLWPGVLLGTGLAVLIAISRLPLHAHSVSEVIAGTMLGLASTAFVLHRRIPQLERTGVGYLPAAGLLTALILQLSPVPTSHHLVVKLAQWVSGQQHLHHRPHPLR